MTTPTTPYAHAKKRDTFWDFTGRLIAGAFKAVLLVLVIAILTPIVFFAWRASQPMQMKEFNGLTFYQVMTWEKTAYARLAQQYDRAHPGKNPVDGQCYTTDVAFVPLRYALAGWYALAGIYPGLQKYISPSDIHNGAVAQDVTWLTFLPTWWKNFEKSFWSGIIYSQTGFAHWCRLPLPLPPGRFNRTGIPHQNTIPINFN